MSSKLVAFLAALIFGLVIAGWAADDSGSHSSRVSVASSYGPGLYGNQLACGGRLYRSTIAVAHKYLRCGTRIRVCYRSRCSYARVRDRGPWVRGRDLDLTEALTYRLCGCSATRWGVRRVQWVVT